MDKTAKTELQKKKSSPPGQEGLGVVENATQNPAKSQHLKTKPL
jgi:hypothetical protein